MDEHYTYFSDLSPISKYLVTFLSDVEATLLSQLLPHNKGFRDFQ